MRRLCCLKSRLRSKLLLFFSTVVRLSVTRNLRLTFRIDTEICALNLEDYH